MADLGIETALIDALRQVARAEVMPRFRNLGAGDIDTKTGPEDLVTIADRAAEAALAVRIARILPGAVIVGEEAVSDNPEILKRLETRGTSVIVDPIDGTANYAHGNATFGMILAVVEAGQIVLGILYDPVLDDWVVGRRGGGAWFCRDGYARPLRVRAARPLDDQVGYLPLYLFPKASQPALAQLYPQVGRMQSLRCSCHEYRMLALGQADFVVAAGSKPWDHAAGMLVLSEAGGDGGALSGGSYDLHDPDARLICATTPETREGLAQLIGGALGG